MRGHGAKDIGQQDLLRARLDAQINMNEPLVRLGQVIRWEYLDSQISQLFSSRTGRPATSTRLIVGLMYLQHSCGLSDEEVVLQWTQNPYWQYFCGEAFFQTRAPIHPSSLTRWRKRLGEEGLELLLQETITTAVRAGYARKSDFKRVSVDTTVQEKAVAYPTDANLIYKGITLVAKGARKFGLKLRQTYEKTGKIMLNKIGRYAHARQYQRMDDNLKELRIRCDSLCRDVCRQIAKLPEVAEQQARAHLQPLFDKIQRLQAQKRDSKNKLYSFHAPEVECISKGKAHKRYEFGVKVGVVTSQRGNWVLGCRSFSGNPYDGDTLHSSLEQASNISGVMPQEAYVDLGYRGKHLLPPDTEFDDIKVIHRNTRNKTPKQRKGLRQHSAIEAMIGHMKNDGKLSRNWLKGVEGDAHNAILCAVGQNFRKLLIQSR